MSIHHRFLLLCAVFSAVAFAVLLSRPGPAASTSSIEPGTAPLRSAYVPGSGITTVATDTIDILTYPYAAYLYTATNTTYNIPYQWLHWAKYNNSHPQPALKTYTRLTLENDWLKVSFLPELGGRIYQINYKPTGHALLYNNWVIKPTNWGPPEQDWWLAAGGIEWGLPVEEHGYEWNIPWSYDITGGTDGITITLRDSTAPDRLRAAIAVFLPNDQGALRIHPRLENDRSVGLNFKWWINAMIAPGYNSVGSVNFDVTQNVQFVYPIDQVTIHSTGDDALPGPNYPTGPTVSMPWPIYNDRDLSYLRNWHQFLGFFVRPAAQSDFAAVYNVNSYEDSIKLGLVRIFPHQIATGLKGFGMGWTNPLPWEQWTDNWQYYVELHGGLAPTFWDSAFLGAHQAIEWDEVWYPVWGLNGLTTGTGDTALQVQLTHGLSDNLDVGVFTTRPIADARVTTYARLPTGCSALAEWSSDLMTPATPFTYSHEVQVPLDAVAVILTSHDQLVSSYNLTNDGQPPATWLRGQPSWVNTTTIPINMMAVDPDCVRSYDLQVRDGWDGQWTTWLTATTQSLNWFEGVEGHTYYFRLRARDLAGNESPYNPDPYGDGVTSVLLTPAPVMDTAMKGVASPLLLWSPMVWSIHLLNTGNLSTTATLTDTLPPLMTILTDTIYLKGKPAPQLYVDGQLRWSGVVNSGEDIYIYYHLSPTLLLTPGTIITNTALIAYDNRVITRTAHTVQPYQAFLPVIAR